MYIFSDIANRLSYGLMQRLPRCSPDVELQYKQWRIPRGVGHFSILVHVDYI
jgi:hypothetical protein